MRTDLRDLPVFWDAADLLQVLSRAEVLVAYVDGGQGHHLLKGVDKLEQLAGGKKSQMLAVCELTITNAQLDVLAAALIMVEDGSMSDEGCMASFVNQLTEASRTR